MKEIIYAHYWSSYRYYNNEWYNVYFDELFNNSIKYIIVLRWLTCINDSDEGSVVSMPMAMWGWIAASF